MKSKEPIKIQVSEIYMISKRAPTNLYSLDSESKKFNFVPGTIIVVLDKQILNSRAPYQIKEYTAYYPKNDCKFSFFERSLITFYLKSVGN